MSGLTQIIPLRHAPLLSRARVRCFPIQSPLGVHLGVAAVAEGWPVGSLFISILSSLMAGCGCSVLCLLIWQATFLNPQNI